MTSSLAVELALAGGADPIVDHVTKCERSVLTDRDQTLASPVAQGFTNRQIAEQLVIAEGTAERYLAAILAKLDMNARSRSLHGRWRKGSSRWK